jgi:hypothetical protein
VTSQSRVGCFLSQLWKETCFGLCRLSARNARAGSVNTSRLPGVYRELRATSFRLMRSAGSGLMNGKSPPGTLIVNGPRYPLVRLLRDRRPLRRREPQRSNSRFDGLPHTRILVFMRSAALALCCITGLQLNAQPASFSGVAIHSTTREPLRGVHITLLSIRKFPEPNQLYGAVSGPDGLFSFPNLPPGLYQLLARQNGFLYLQDENRDFPDIRIVLKPGGAVSDRTVPMTPEAILTGRVTDEFGDPVENAFVDATPVTGDDSRSVVLSRMNGFTDERGQFRITGAAGPIPHQRKDLPATGSN